MSSVWCSGLCSGAALQQRVGVAGEAVRHAEGLPDSAVGTCCVQMHARSFESNDHVDQSRRIASRAMSSRSSSLAPTSAPPAAVERARSTSFGDALRRAAARKRSSIPGDERDAELAVGIARAVAGPSDQSTSRREGATRTTSPGGPS